jgi:hypothetical protein
MPDLSLAVINTTVTPISDRQSRIDLVLADDSDLENAKETVAILVVVDHKAVPLLLEFQLAAIDRARIALIAQTRQIGQTLNQVRP